MKAIDYKNALRTDSVVRMPVFQDGVSLFDLIPNCTFKIPLYQRAFAWGTPPHEVNENELICLMDDICGASDATEYYVGSVVVKSEEKDGRLTFEVIDGQQRLTAFFILLNCLGIEIKTTNPLDYAQRTRSVQTVKRIGEIVRFAKALLNKEKQDGVGGAVRRGGGDETNGTGGGGWWFGNDELESSMCDGVVAVLRHLMTRGVKSDYESCLKDGLSKVRLYLVQVPDNTDLNRYFEVMNTRGEQLAPQDIVKATLMRHIVDIRKRDRFAQIWNACSDMNGYVQMHFSPDLRDEIFGADWSGMPQVEDVEGDEIAEEVGESICASLLRGKEDDGERKQDATNDASGEPKEEASDPVRFRSIIYFPHFLLNVLRVFNHANGTGYLDVKSELDVSKMIWHFENLFKVQGNADGEELPEEVKARIAWDFAKCLLSCRFLFDKYMVKRDYARNSVDGEWSIKQLRVSGTGSDRTAYYVLSDWQEKEDNAKKFAREKSLMLQSCLRVTYTEFKGMHWVTTLLDWLYRHHVGGKIDLAEYVRGTEKIVCTAAKDGADRLKSENHRMGTLTPHVIFNYLDYLLWEDAKEKRRFVEDGGSWEPFAFAYRNSVEHWYPQHPEGYQKIPQLIWINPDEKGRRAVDQFGNLCVVQPSENSKFSNLKPSAKKIQYKSTVLGGSLKLRLMAAQTPEDEVRWKEVCAEHGKEMLTTLEEAFKRVLGIKPNGNGK